MFKKMFKAKNIYFFLCSGIISLCVIYFFTCFAYFPNQINLFEGKKQYFSFKIPLDATIYPNNIEAIHVNGYPVTDNITVNLGESLSIEAPETGQASMYLNAFGMPIKKVSLEVNKAIEVIPCGITVGVKIKTEGIMVLGCDYVVGEDGSSTKPSEGILKSGDLILKANEQELETREQFIDIIEKSDKEIKLELKRDEQIIQTSIKPIKSAKDSKNKIGIWIRDTTQGIGTLTYYNPDNGKFGALGHGILDVDTKKLMTVKTGEVSHSEITSIKKGKKGVPGELIGDIKGNIMGEVKVNSFYGIYGSLFAAPKTDFIKEKMEIMLQNEIHEGPATILCNVSGTKVMEYDVYIESVNRYSTDDSKGMVLKITDTQLLEKTNGIVQGMSGSPIIQDNKLIGAVTHVFVQDPTKGYGIFIENMLKQEKGI